MAIINGTSKGDSLNGFDGDDVLEGGAGADELFGSAGIENVVGTYLADQIAVDGMANGLTGSFAADALRGRGGADRFDFDNGDASDPKAPDLILDFSRSQKDRIGTVIGGPDPVIVLHGLISLRADPFIL